MKKIIFSLLVFVSFFASAQKKKDSTAKAPVSKDTLAKDTAVQVLLSQQQFNTFLQWLDSIHEDHQAVKAVQTLFINNAQLLLIPKKK